MRTLELLAPAKNLECGIAAIDHGADAVYIGAPRFGARAAASNSIEDIKQLCDYSHQFGAKVHVTVNTIIYDSELEDTLKMISQLDEIGVDALLLQDMGLLWEVRAKGLWKRELHSSTQCDTRTPEKALWLTQIGSSEWFLHVNCHWMKSKPSTMLFQTERLKSSCMVLSASVIPESAMHLKNASPVLPTVVNVPSSAV